MMSFGRIPTGMTGLYAYSSINDEGKLDKDTEFVFHFTAKTCFVDDIVHSLNFQRNAFYNHFKPLAILSSSCIVC
jgi:hypothetical protein